MKRYFSLFIIIFFLLFGMCFFACYQNLSKEQKAMAKDVVVDTTRFLKVANFVSEEEREKIISEECLLPNGKKRAKGLRAIPQDNDDFRRAMLDGVYWNGIHAENSDFRGASVRSAKCNETNFSYSDFRVADIRWTLFDRSILYNCNFAQAKLFHDHVNDSRLDSSDFRGANMFGMTGHRASLKNCDFTNAKNIPDVIKKHLVNGKMTGVVLER